MRSSASRSRSPRLIGVYIVLSATPTRPPIRQRKSARFIPSDWLHIRLLFDRLKPVAPAHTGIIQARKELAMSSRQDENPQFEAGLPELSTPELTSTPTASEAAMLRELQFASDTVLRLATRTHSAVARSDAAAAEEVRAALERQLAQTTGLIDELLFGSSDPLTKH